MSAPDTTVFQFNFKDPQGNLHNIYATNGEEAVELLDAFQANILSKVFEVQTAIQAVTAVAAPARPAAPATSPSVATPPAPDGDAPLCEHGVPAKLVPAGIAKATGKPYRAFYACAQPRATQCNFRASV